jgi:hypothetical protein
MSIISTWVMIYGNVNRISLFYLPFVVMSVRLLYIRNAEFFNFKAISFCVVNLIIVILIGIAVYNISTLHMGFSFFIAIIMLVVMDVYFFEFYKTTNLARLSLIKIVENL